MRKLGDNELMIELNPLFPGATPEVSVPGFPLLPDTGMLPVVPELPMLPAMPFDGTSFNAFLINSEIPWKN